ADDHRLAADRRGVEAALEHVGERDHPPRAGRGGGGDPTARAPGRGGGARVGVVDPRAVAAGGGGVDRLALGHLGGDEREGRHAVVGGGHAANRAVVVEREL